jgi:histidinol phosphatase-like enzyme (inositol monophosphatase family)
MNYARELEFARRLATAAGSNAKHIRAGGVSAETKSDTSPVTLADRENERMVREAIESEFPGDGILGEEGSSKLGSGKRRWIVDPIDGTRDFVRGNRFWCVLIALEEAGEPVVGVAHFPLLDETYWAVRGNGSYRNQDRLRVSTVDSIHSCVFSPNGLHQVEARPYLAGVTDFMQRSWAVRTFGGPLDACLLAAGMVDVWFEPKLEIWDIAALKLIIEEAGGDFFALDGSRRMDRGTVLACAPGISDQVLEAFGMVPA